MKRMVKAATNVQAGYNPLLLDELIQRYQGLDADTAYESVLNEFNDEDLANDVVDGIEDLQNSISGCSVNCAEDHKFWSTDVKNYDDVLTEIDRALDAGTWFEDVQDYLRELKESNLITESEYYDGCQYAYEALEQ